MLLISMLGVKDTFFILKVKKVRTCKDIYTPMLPISCNNVRCYRHVPIQISNVSGDISLLKPMGALNKDLVILRNNYIWDILDVDWSQIKVLVNTNKEIRLSTVCNHHTRNTQIQIKENTE